MECKKNHSKHSIFCAITIKLGKPEKVTDYHIQIQKELVIVEENDEREREGCSKMVGEGERRR